MLKSSASAGSARWPAACRFLPQIPIFLSLFHVLRRLAPEAQGLYSWSPELTDEAARAPFFGAPISSSFVMSGPKAEAIIEITGGYTNIRVVAFLLILIMSLTTFFTQKQINAALRAGRGSGRDGAEAGCST
jgi:YidC/Oxa1 family membrane protein insertase